MKVSVVLITYNHERFITQAVESVLNQEVDFPYEVIISEDCSTDGTRGIISEFQRRYPERIRLLLSERNLNTNMVLSRGIQTAGGQYIALLDGDDYWTDTCKLQKQARFLDTHPGCSICFHNVRVVYEDGRREAHPFHVQTPEHPISARIPKAVSTLDDLAGGNFIQTCSVMFRSRLFEEFPPWYDGSPLGDWPLHILNAEHGDIGYLDEVLAAYRVHSGGIWSAQMSRYRTIEDVEKVISMYEVLNRHLKLRYAEKINKKLTPLYEKAMRILYQSRQYKRARSYARSYFLSLPLKQRIRQLFLLKVTLRAIVDRYAPLKGHALAEKAETPVGSSAER
jgi:glycosyltransferase involved in cell wall biosynthesis